MREIVLNGYNERCMSKAVRQQCIWIVRDIERLKTLANMGIENDRFGPYEIVLYADEMEGLIPAGVVDDALFKINSINKAIGTVPIEYRTGILNNISKHKKFNDTATINTWKIWKERFIHNLAKNLNLC